MSRLIRTCVGTLWTVPYGTARSKGKMMPSSIHIRRLSRGLVPVASAALLLAGGALPANAAPLATRFTQVSLVANKETPGAIVDPNLINPWGLAVSPTGPLWVANNGTDTSTLYRGGVNGAPATQAPLIVTVDGTGATGQVFNDTTQFVVTGPNGTGGAAPFIFSGESGDITAWNPNAFPTRAATVAHVDGAVYKGLALLHAATGPQLLAPDFAGGHIDIFDGTFQRVAVAPGLFQDPTLPANYSPFNVFVDPANNVYVSYALRGADGNEVAGRGLGFVDRYDSLGLTRTRIASRGTLNAPWGMAIAPASFGTLAGTLLVGNFGDGRISAYRDVVPAGLLRTSAGRPLVIDGLWALLPGTAATGGINALWFSAGPNDEADGLIGEVLPAS